GAVEEVLNRCSAVINTDFVTIPISNQIKDRIISANNEMASSGLRVLAFAHKKGISADDISGKDIEANLAFLGIVGMFDPARPEVIDAISECKTAGIDIVMI